MVTEWAFLIPAVIVGLVIWWRLLVGLPSEADSLIRVEGFRAGDAVLACVLAGYFLLGIASSSDEPRVVTKELILAGGLIYLVLAVFVVTFFRMRGLDVWDLFGLKRVRWWPEVGIAVVGLLAVYPLVSLSSWIVRSEMGDSVTGDSTVEFLKNTRDPATLLAAGVLVIIIAPCVEELLFRGLLYGVAKRYAGRLAAAVTTSVLFAAIHLNPASWVPLFFLSLAFTLGYERTGSLWTPILMHLLFNGAQFLILLLFPQWLQ
jgi:membrane protease YdiL (CAAX protease family)